MSLLITVEIANQPNARHVIEVRNRGPVGEANAAGTGLYRYDWSWRGRHGQVEHDRDDGSLVLASEVIAAIQAGRTP